MRGILRPNEGNFETYCVNGLPCYVLEVRVETVMFLRTGHGLADEILHFADLG